VFTLFKVFKGLVALNYCMVFDSEDPVEPHAPSLRSLSAKVIIDNALRLLSNNDEFSNTLRQEGLLCCFVSI
jgi:hypothetical protein